MLIVEAVENGVVLHSIMQGIEHADCLLEGHMGPGRRGQIPRRFGSEYRHIPSPHLLELTAFDSSRDLVEFVQAA
ncbi:hypothetical protein [Novosphingobium sp. FKTRR1]|uniref:hypothetical protein n=1 Tax=Novosphingobium sp. FKTRR1 TaxID=2879118 RepID=UPI001CF04E58|nr:hypothetical protein [Novosphingobium sp. FKTRR1]